MKKFYSIALAAALAFSASAQDFVQTQLPGFTVKNFNGPIERVARPAAPKATIAKAAATAQDLVGGYVWTGYDFFDGEDITKGSVISLNEDGTLSIRLELVDVKATFNPENSTISIEPGQEGPEVQLTSGGTAIPVFLHGIWNQEAQGFDPSDEPLIGFVTEEGITFGGEDDGILVGARVGDKVDGFFIVMDSNKFERYSPAIEDGWTEIGLCKYQDSWAINCFSVDPANFTWDVMVVKNNDNENLLRLIDPYTTPLLNPGFAGVNTNTESAYIEINIADPDFVMVTPGIYGGFTYPTDMSGISQYPFNREGLMFKQLKEQYPTATDEDIISTIVSQYPDVQFSNYKDGIITISNCVFGDEAEPEAPYAWQDKQGNSTMTSALIYLPGSNSAAITDVTVDNSNAPVEYYNLQGLRVENPANGIFIRRQGNKATKVLVK